MYKRSEMEAMKCYVLLLVHCMCNYRQHNRCVLRFKSVARAFSSNISYRTHNQKQTTTTFHYIILFGETSMISCVCSVTN